MASKVQIILTDDIDGSDADETVTFSLDGIDYEIDLTSDHAAELREQLEAYVSAARRVSGRAKPKARTTVAPRPKPKPKAGMRTEVVADPATVRAWASANGVDVSPRGRIKTSVMEAFLAAGV
jgi:hypothetical protein